MIYQQYPNYQQFQPNFQQQFQQPQATSIPQQIQPTIQNGGFVSVRSEQEARNYPVAPGISLTFKDENSPYVYTKTMGFSQLDRPQFEKYRLVKEEADECKTIEQPQPLQYLVEDDLQPIIDKLKTFDENSKSNYEELKNEIKQLKFNLKEIEKGSVKQISTKPISQKQKEDK